MEDGEQISSTTPFESGFGGDWMAESRPAAAQFHDNEAVAKEDDDILDLAGGAKEALERHRAYDYDSTPFGQPQKAADPSPMPPASMDAGPLFGDAGVRRMPAAGEAADTPPKPQVPEAVPVIPAKKTQSPSPSSGSLLKRWNIDRRVVDLLYWRDVKTTGVVFGAALFLLLSLSVCSIISVCSYVGLALLSVTITFRIYKGILQAVQKSDEGHPFKTYLTQEVTLSEDLVHKYSDMALTHLNCTLKELRRLFLVEDLVDSLKFAVLMWILTYIGALFNGLTLLILGLIAVFSTPVIYEKHQAQIDHYLALARTQIKDIFGKVQAKVPGMKPKAE
ncbi:reticulon-1-A-like isoform X4 [Brienomyrus brachyistius]|uniref:reticulon-1-A-like isoform X4 n=1 Tax=Brienomyrus brachyistius TaxID=42636 RepID=UPI0020B39116|nr:reticulon-1-A-like isoform X4 [Brienomyrus brachyistius]